MKRKRLTFSTFCFACLIGVTSCNSVIQTPINMSENNIYSLDLNNDGILQEEEQNLSWEQSYDKGIALVKSSDDQNYRFGLMHKLETLLMSTGATCPLYYYTNNFLLHTNVEGFYSSPLGYKFFRNTAFTDAPDKREITLCLASEPSAIDPALNSTVDGGTMDSHLFSGLYRYADDGEGNAILIPDLAKEAPTKTKNEDGSTTYHFVLRDDIFYSDGTEIVASDFYKSWKRAGGAALGADYSYMFDIIKGHTESGEIDETVVSCDDEAKTIDLTLEADIPYLDEILAFPAYFVIKDADKVDAKGTWAMNAGFVTSGAYTIQSWNHNQMITLTKNSRYWNKETDTMDTIRFALSDSDSNMYTNFLNGTYALIDNPSPDTISSEKGKPELHSKGQLGVYYIGFNTNCPTFSDVADTEEKRQMVRRALSYFIDRESIITLSANGAIPATGFVPNGLTDPLGGEYVDHNGPTGNGEGYTGYDPEQGVELLRQVGYDYDESRQKFTDFPILNYLYNTGDGHKLVAECIQSDFKRYGITIQLKNQEWNTFIDTRKKGICDIARNGWVADYNDPITFLDMFTTDSGNNDCQLGKDDMWSR